VAVLYKFTIVSRISGLAVQLLRGLVLLLFVGCSLGQDLRTQDPPGEPASIEKRVRAIRAEAKRIDAAVDAPEAPGRRRLAIEFPHWQLTGLFEDSTPIFVNALFTEGQAVREESYYFLHGKLLLVKVRKWWDVEDESKQPGPETHQDFYVDGDLTIRHVVKVASSRPVTRTGNKSRPAAALIERSRSLAQILVSGTRDAAVTDSLKLFREAEVTKP
jgi:hypothetical protein